MEAFENGKQTKGAWRALSVQGGERICSCLCLRQRCCGVQAAKMTHDQLQTETTMELKNAHRHHRVHFIVKVALQAATLIAAGLAVHELDRINHRLKKIEKRERRHLL